MTDALTPITRDRVDADALKVVRRLQQQGHQAYLVGGCVRDLLLDRAPKDFDVATSATPDELKRVFRNCRIIGRRFRLAHIYFGPKIIETSTFRAAPEHDPGAEGEDRIIWRDNVFGTAREDALRRDFTINGLFYDPYEGKVIDHVEGLEDIRLRRVRTIGDPWVRFQEDPVRILRAVKFAARLNMQIGPNTWSAILDLRGMVAKCAVVRVLEEIYRLLGEGSAAPAFRLLHRSGVLGVLFPELQRVISEPEESAAREPVMPLQSRPRRGGPAADDPMAADDGLGVLAPTNGQPPGQRQVEEQLARLHLAVLGDSPEAHARVERWLWPHLEALDALRLSSSRPPSHGFLLSTLLMSLASSALCEAPSNREAFEQLDELITAIADRLCISRRDRQDLHQLLVAQSRMVHRGRRFRPRALLDKEYFAEAFQLLELSCTAADHHLEELEQWRALRVPETLVNGRSGRGHRPRRRRRTRGRDDSADVRISKAIRDTDT